MCDSARQSDKGFKTGQTFVRTIERAIMEGRAERLRACRYSRVANMIEIEVEIDAELPAAEVAEMQVHLPVLKSLSSHEGSTQSHHQCHMAACTILESNALSQLLQPHLPYLWSFDAE